MIRREVLATAQSPDAGVVTLVREAQGYVIYSDGRVLMNSHTHGSEAAMTVQACRAAAKKVAPRVLVGGLGLGYTLRATLDRLPADATVVCAELIDAVVEWHRGPIGPLAGHPIDDPRVQLAGDVVALIRDLPPDQAFDAILLDVDNGPVPLTTVDNWWLYSNEGIARMREVLTPGGVVVVWSASEDKRFAARMRAAGLATEVVRVHVRTGRPTHRRRGRAHVLFVGRRVR